jgi:seryl-tRNA synthetase
MLDIKLFRTDADAVARAMKSRGLTVDVEAIVKLDQEHRAALQELEEAQAQQNSASKGPMEPERITELKALKEKITGLRARVDELGQRVLDAVAPLPNIPLEDTPVGKSGDENVEVSRFGEPRTFDFTPKHYMDFAPARGLIDTEMAGVVSGSRFGYLKGGAALLQFALLQYAVSRLTSKGFIAELIEKNNLPIAPTPFTAVIPPVMIKPEMMRAMGFSERAGVPPGGDESYWLDKDGLYLVGTSEQSIGPMHYDTITNPEELPLRYVGYSTCFRRESGAAGKDTRGILRVHQFDKLEMFIVASPENSPHEHRLILAAEEALMQGLGLHYRVMRLCTGDIGAASASTFDIETWMPGQREYRETSSTSNTTDYQSRALKARYRTGEKSTALTHMLNGTAFALGRMIIAILENYQNEDGSVEVPDALRPYMGGVDVIEG